MVNKLLTSIFLFCILSIAGCAPLVVGAGAGAGVYTYMEGELTRAYQASFDKTNRASIAILKKLKISLIKETCDGINTTISGKRADGTPVTIKTKMLAPKITEVSVRSGYLGVWDKQISELIHASIAQRLQ